MLWLQLNIASNKKKSTSIEVLNEIVDKHPIVALIISNIILYNKSTY